MCLPQFWKFWKKPTQSQSTESQRESKITPAPSLPRKTSEEEQEDAVREYVREAAGWPSIRLAIIGKHGVGKSSLSTRISSNAWLGDWEYGPTDTDQFRMCVPMEDKFVQYEGDEEHPSLVWPPQSIIEYWFARHCEVCVFAYDVSKRDSFDALKIYYDNFCLERSVERDFCLFNCRPVCAARPPYRGFLYVIGNKIDHDESEWAVSRQEGEAFATSIGATFLPMSAKTGKGWGRNSLRAITSTILLRRIQSSQAGTDKQAIKNKVADPWTPHEKVNRRTIQSQPGDDATPASGNVQEKALTQKQEETAAVREYVNNFDGQPQIRI